MICTYVWQLLNIFLNSILLIWLELLDDIIESEGDWVNTNILLMMK